MQSAPPPPIAFRTRQGLVLRGVRWGAGPRPVLFTHGNGFTVQCYARALQALLPGCQVHALNLRGHGGSDVPADYPDWSGPMQDMLEFIRALGAGPVLLAGHSYGATLSLWLAAQAPELVSGLLLMEPVVLAQRGQPWPPADMPARQAMLRDTRERRAAWPSREEASQWLRGRGTYRTWAPAAWEEFIASGFIAAADGTVRLACPPWLEAAAYATHPDGEMFDWAQQVRVPAVFLHGTSLAPVQRQALQELAGLIPISAVYALSGGHCFAMEHPRATGRALAEGLALIERALAPSPA